MILFIFIFYIYKDSSIYHARGNKEKVYLGGTIAHFCTIYQNNWIVFSKRKRDESGSTVIARYEGN
jgi:hypothetical protein